MGKKWDLSLKSPPVGIGKTGEKKAYLKNFFVSDSQEYIIHRIMDPFRQKLCRTFRKLGR